MQHGINGRHRAHDEGVAPLRRAQIGWIALGLISLVASCSSETTGSSMSGANTTGGAGTGSVSGGGSAQCAIGVQDVIVSEGVGSSPAVAFADDHYLVVWTSTAKDAGDIRVALLDAKGTKVNEQAVAETLGESSFPSVIPEAGGGFLVVWQDKAIPGSMVKGRRIDAQGMPKGAAFQVAQSASAEARPSVAPATVGAAIAWADTTASTVGDLTGEMITVKTPIDQAISPSFGGSGTNLGITWAAGEKVGASRVASPGAPLTPVLFRSAPGKANAPRIAVHDDASLSVVWEDSRDGDGNETIYLTRIDKGGAAGAEKLVPTSTESANYPDVAWTGSHDAIVYYQFRDGPPAIYLSLIAPNLVAKGKDLKVSGDGIAARYPRITRTGDTLGTLGVVYAEKDGNIRLSLVACP
jgi:hypothetical protein